MWHSFRRRNWSVITPVLYYFTPYNKKNIGTGFFSVINVENGWQHQVILEEHFKRAQDFLFDKLQDDKNLIKKSLVQSRKISKEYLLFCRKNLKNGLDKKSDKDLASLLDKYHSLYEKFSVANIPPWMFLADKLSAFLIDSLSKISKEANNVFILLSTPNYKSYLKEEELDVLGSVLKIKEGKSDIEKEAKKLSDKYFWIPFDYIGPDVWDESYYVKKIESLMGLGTLEKNIDKILSDAKELVNKQKAEIKRLNIPKDSVLLFETMKDIAILQDEKKSLTTESHYYLQNLYKEIAKRIGMDYLDLYMMLFSEIKESLLTKENMTEIVGYRKELSLTIMDGKTSKVLHGADARNYARENNIILMSDEKEEKSDVIMGVPAAAGKTKGKVRVLSSAKEVGKMQEGEILVATMTTPDYVPAMKKAKAIITDEGGITCHAAIVSRELGIPCVIGTKNATKILKDGDLVEVDADKGIIRII